MGRFGRTFVVLLSTWLSSSLTTAIELNIDDRDSIKSAASTVAYGMMTWYKGNESGQVPGYLPQPYYWWEAGAMFGSLIDYWYYTGDSTYNDVTMQALQFQVGQYDNYEPVNVTAQLGNDDQCFWGIAAMSAAELGFPNPPPQQPQWLALAQAVFTRQTTRWEPDLCGGGLRWQIVSTNKGYNYKNVVSNGGFFALAARLGAYTGNQTYFDWANKAYDWMLAIDMIGSSFEMYDGASTDINCSSINKLQWTYNNGVMLLGAAVMWNQTTGDVQNTWAQRINATLAAGRKVFFYNGTAMWEFQCEENYQGPAICNTDQLSFKAYLSRWMAATIKVAPWTSDQIRPLLRSSAIAAANQCTGGQDGTTCGSRWWRNFDGVVGVGQQMSALEVIQSNLIEDSRGPVSADTGGTSQGNPDAGTTGYNVYAPPKPLRPITEGDKAGAGFLTALVLLVFTSGAYWMSAD